MRASQTNSPSINNKDKKSFHSYEFLCIKKFQEDFCQIQENSVVEDAHELWTFVEKLLEKVKDLHSNETLGLQGLFWKFRFDKRIAADLWYLAAALDKSPQSLLEFLAFELNKNRSCTGTPLSRYLSRHQFQEIHLDGIFRFYDRSSIPLEIFKCENVRVLSLKSNSLTSIPSDIGRLSKLKVLCLTDNCLQNHSIPFSLTFCKNLTHLYLDSNLLDALPGFLLSMIQLDTVYRHGNHNYFKSTFMWYHTDIHERIRSTNTRDELLRKRKKIFQPTRLQDLAVQSVIGSKENFFEPGLFPIMLQNYIAQEYTNYHVCGYCNTAQPVYKSGYKVFTFKTPYLGNTCVPFQHWACSFKCAEDIEKPAHAEQKMYAQRIERAYSEYIGHCQKEYEGRGDRRGTSSRRRRKRKKCSIM